MKFCRAHFENFRLLRDFEITFSRSEDHPITVVRGENETGKSTIHAALQWVLFGRDGLPNDGRSYRLHPIDWDVQETERVPVTGEIEFVHQFGRRDDEGNLITTKERYLARRQVFERITGRDEWQRQDEDFSLFKITEAGHTPVEEGRLKLEQMMESSVKDVFFTDGDRALTFISGELRPHRRKELVQEALRDMLGLDLLDSSIDHLKNAVKKFRVDPDESMDAGELEQLGRKLNKIENKIDETEEEMENLKENIQQVESQQDEFRSRLNVALEEGDREELAEEREEVEAFLDSASDQRDELAARHARIFTSEAFAFDIVEDEIEKAKDLLEELRSRGEIPRNAVPLLRERMEMKECVCGRDLVPGEKPYRNLKKVIEEQSQRSPAEERLTELRLGVQQRHEESLSSEWRSSLKEIVGERDKLDKEIKNAQAKAKKLERSIDELPDTDVQELRRQIKELKETEDNLRRKIGRKESDLERLRRKRDEVNSEREKAQNRATKELVHKTRETAANDILELLTKAHDEIENREIPEVSELMNEYFLEMVQADPEQNAVIQEAEITDDYEIVVYGPSGRQLDTDQALNGASRRALTLSFILALTDVSGVEAPNVIDTPLGMTSGHVRRAIVRVAAREASQLVLFLTRSEIAGCEDILEERAGNAVTITNTAHYPSMLANDPGVEEQKVVICDCGFREYCEICKREGDEESDLTRRH
jgi:DNA sulfur modification protein DndD